MLPRSTQLDTQNNESTKLYLEAMEEAKSLIQDVLPNTQILFNPITGIDLADYNSKERKGLNGEELRVYHESKVNHPMQIIINDTVIRINQKISKFNNDNKVATPWSAPLVHKYEKGPRYYHHYQYLSDGCHLLDECIVIWAEKFQKAITKSIEINTE